MWEDRDWTCLMSRYPGHTQVPQIAILFPILLPFQPHIFGVFRIASLNVNISQHRELFLSHSSAQKSWTWYSLDQNKPSLGPLALSIPQAEMGALPPKSECSWVGRGFLSKRAGDWSAVKELRMLLILVITPHKVFFVQCPENHASDNPGPGHRKHVQMTPTLSPLLGQKKEEWKGQHEECYTTQSQGNWRNTILWTNRKRAKGNMFKH